MVVYNWFNEQVRFYHWFVWHVPAATQLQCLQSVNQLLWLWQVDLGMTWHEYDGKVQQWLLTELLSLLHILPCVQTRWSIIFGEHSYFIQHMYKYVQFLFVQNSRSWITQYSGNSIYRVGFRTFIIFPLWNLHRRKTDKKRDTTKFLIQL